MIEQTHLETYADRFVHRRDIFARQNPDGSYFLRRTPPTSEVIRAHLTGHFTAGWYALGKDDTTRWVVLDADREDGLEQLQQAWQRLDRREIPAQLELSRRGGHLWVLFEPISARVAKSLILGALPGLDGVEVFPKRDRLDAGRGVGTLVRGPLGIHQLTGHRYPFVVPISLTPVSSSVVGTLEYLQTAPRISVTQAGEHLASLLEEAQRPTSAPDQAAPRSGSQASAIRRLNERIGDLYSFVSRYVELDAHGRGPCPFHPPDTNPSFAVHRAGYWVCFHETDPRTGHYLGGDAVAFYRRLKGLSYRETIRELQELLATNEVLTYRA